MNKIQALFSQGRLKDKEYISIFKRLAFLLKGGVPLGEAIQVLQLQSREGKKQRAEKDFFEKVAGEVLSGKTLSSSIASFQKRPNNFVISVISLGEISGTLGENLDYIAIELEKRRQLFRKILGSLAYPAVVGLATIGVTVLLTVYIFPKIQPIFSSLHTSLPLSTKILVFFSSTLRSYGFLIFGLLILLVFAFFFLIKKFPQYRLLTERWILRLPFFGALLQEYSLANASRLLGLLFTHGAGAPHALHIVSGASTSLLYKSEFALGAETLSSGMSLCDVLSKSRRLFPSSFTHMVSVGESAGTLGETLSYLARFYEQELDEKTKTITSALEPALMVMMGLVVGFVAVSIITPIYQITQNLHA